MTSDEMFQQVMAAHFELIKRLDLFTDILRQIVESESDSQEDEMPEHL